MFFSRFRHNRNSDDAEDETDSCPYMGGSDLSRFKTRDAATTVTVSAPKHIRRRPTRITLTKPQGFGTDSESSSDSDPDSDSDSDLDTLSVADLNEFARHLRAAMEDVQAERDRNYGVTKIKVNRPSQRGSKPKIMTILPSIIEEFEEDTESAESDTSSDTLQDGEDEDDDVFWQGVTHGGSLRSLDGLERRIVALQKELNESRRGARTVEAMLLETERDLEAMQRQKGALSAERDHLWHENKRLEAQFQAERRERRRMAGENDHLKATMKRLRSCPSLKLTRR